jgi:tricarboxylate carrier
MSKNSVTTPPAGEDTSSWYPKVDIEKPEFDQSSYLGRVKLFYKITNPMTLFKSSSAIKDAQKLIEDFKNNKLTKSVTEKELWYNKTLRDSAIHPDSGKVIPFIARMSCFVPANVTIVAGMLNSFSIPGVILWQTINQVYNAFLNSENAPKNDSLQVSRNKKIVNFSAAIVSSVGTAVGLNEIVKRSSKFNPSVKKMLLRYTPFVAVCAANVCNIMLTRQSDLKTGVGVKDQEGNDRGISKIAGRKAVFQTLESRLLLVVPSVFIPGTVINILDGKKLLPKNMIGNLSVNLAVTAAVLLVCLPWCIGLFPQYYPVKAEKLEEQFRDLKDSKGQKIDTLIYNKGL